MVAPNLVRSCAVLIAALPLMSLSPAPGATAKAGGPATPRECFDFAKASGFKVEAPDRIRISIAERGDYDVDLGSGCAGLAERKDIALRSVPIGLVCTGAQPPERNLTFKDAPGSEALSCAIKFVQPALNLPTQPLQPGQPPAQTIEPSAAAAPAANPPH